MKILLVSHGFRPSIGGIEAMSELLADGFREAGHEVHVLTKSGAGPHQDDERLPYRVTRSPGPREVWRLVADADVVFHNNVSMRYAWPLLFLRRPWTVATHTWIRRTDDRRGLVDWLKLKLLKFATSICASYALARDLGLPSVTIANAYDNKLFVLMPEADRLPDSLIFVGRLVPGKGVHVLLAALRELGREDYRPSLTIIGEGQERAALEAMTLEYGLGGQVRFLGALGGRELVKALNEHEIMVIPSLWNEPFGVVALEGAACGCTIVGTANGGLSEAVGPCGVVVPNGNITALAGGIRRTLGSLPASNEFRRLRDRHLERHSPEAMVASYLAVLTEAQHPADLAEVRDHLDRDSSR